MRVFAIGDVHLSFGAEKPMDIFGAAWSDHAARLEAAWRSTVSPGDLVLIPGDISWAMRLADALPDFAFLDALPGKKLLLRGNHDYWWSSLAKVRAALPPSIRAIQNDSACYPGLSVAGTRGWISPGAQAFSADDEKIYARELLRLELSLKTLPKAGRRIAMLHFPPFADGKPTAFCTLLSRYGVEKVVYGHLHGHAHASAFEGTADGVEYIFVAGDRLGFCPKRIL